MAPVRGEYPGAKSGYGSDATQVAGQEASNEQTPTRMRRRSR